MDNKKLISLALKAVDNAYAPYSGFKVGAALLCDDGTVYTGCNVENAAFGPTICAERTAFFKAISEGKRLFSAIAIVGGKNGKIDKYFWPCGVCRQVMSEFCDDNFKIITAINENDYVEQSLSEMLPNRFSPDNLRKD